jgi:hypothetical protein
VAPGSHSVFPLFVFALFQRTLYVAGDFYMHYVQKKVTNVFRSDEISEIKMNQTENAKQAKKLK